MNTVDNVNPDILRTCREQMAYDLAFVRKKIPSVDKLESGEKKPTFGQLAKLSKLYCVPDWVFISDQMPEEYKLSASHSFRHIRKSRSAGVPAIPKIRQLISKVDGYRRMIIEYREDMDEFVSQYNAISCKDDYKAMATAVRKWLGITKPLRFEDLRKRVEQKDIFVFMTSKFNHWSKSDMEEFRGFAIYKDVLPMIVLMIPKDFENDNLNMRVRLLGHILRKKSIIDISDSPDEEENWCNNFADHVLMPEEQIRSEISGVDSPSLEQIQKWAEKFYVSSGAFVVHLYQLGIIDQDTRISYLTYLKKARKANKKLGDRNIPIARQIHKEALRKFGGIYSQTVWQAYYNEQIGLHKLCKLFEIKRASVALSI
ncbi:MAG: ImmA/IrrE family metallo-endopeptidase [Gammaproteobacteria bacterium WSBS_2016_MAG_OTU1]